MATCSSCRAAIVWLKTSAGRPMPVDATSAQEGDAVYVPGRHISHFATCPDAAKHRKPKTQKSLFGDEE